MAVRIGGGDFVYEVAEGWGNLPEGWGFKEVAAVGVDAQGRVYAFNRGEHPVIVFDRDGKFLNSWGEGMFPRAHGVTMGPDETIYLTDDDDHTVRKCTYDGRVLLTVGVSGKPAPFHSGNPFNRCTHVAICPINNDFYVSDGYGNASVHKYDEDGNLLFSWGGPGTEPGQFNIVHNISTDKDGYVYVADRENHRVQVFNSKGKYETQWVNMAKPCGLYMDDGEFDAEGRQLLYIGELGATISANQGAPGMGPRVSIYNLEGEVLARLGDTGPGLEAGRFIAPHGIALDANGDMYVAEVSWTNTGSLLDPPREIRSLQKLVKVKGG